MQKFSEEYKRKMNVEDTHTIHNCVLLHAFVRKLELEMVALKEREEGSAARTAARSARKSRQWRVQLRVPWRTMCKRRASTWISTRLELKGW